MDKEKLVGKIFDIHYRYAKEIMLISDRLCITGENGVLFHLCKNGGQLSSGELAGILELTSGRIANILKSLEKKGLIMRERASDDRRHVMARLTEKGHERVEQIYADSRDLMQKILANIDEEYVGTYLDISEKVLLGIQSWQSGKSETDR